jgi:Holliday junction resolvasome RuvABC endonuclease subunit
MNVIALDLGSTTGWATSFDGVINSGTKSFALTKYEGRGMQFLKFRRFLSELTSMVKPDFIVLEEVRRHLGTDAAHAYGGYLSHVGSYCEEANIPHAGVAVGTIKKFATGRGNANKDEMVEAAKIKYLDQDIEDDNQADALMLLGYAMQEIASPEWGKMWGEITGE